MGWRFSIGVLVASLGLGLTEVGQAAPIDRGPFDDGLGGSIDLYYDGGQDITWLGDANFALTSGLDADGRMTWSEASAWATGLTVGGFTDWRLPDVFDTQNNTNNEMGQLFLVDGVSASTPAPFVNVQSSQYWTGVNTSPTQALSFHFGSGLLFGSTQSSDLFAWAVRDGDVTAAVPEPSLALVLGAWLLGLLASKPARQG